MFGKKLLVIAVAMLLTFSFAEESSIMEGNNAFVDPDDAFSSFAPNENHLIDLSFKSFARNSNDDVTGDWSKEFRIDFN